MKLIVKRTSRGLHQVESSCTINPFFWWVLGLKWYDWMTLWVDLRIKVWSRLVTNGMCDHGVIFSQLCHHLFQSFLWNFQLTLTNSVLIRIIVLLYSLILSFYLIFLENYNSRFFSSKNLGRHSLLQVIEYLTGQSFVITLLQ